MGLIVKAVTVHTDATWVVLYVKRLAASTAGAARWNAR